MDLSTVVPQSINEVFAWLTLLGVVVVSTLAVYVARRARELSRYTQLHLDFAELLERFTALEDRFTRFQRREGMRAARTEKTSAEDLKREAEAILAKAGGSAGAAGQPASRGVAKTDLYRRRFNS